MQHQHEKKKMHKRTLWFLGEIVRECEYGTGKENQRVLDTIKLLSQIKLTAGAVVIINELAKIGTGVGITFKRQSGKKCIINLKIV